MTPAEQQAFNLKKRDIWMAIEANPNVTARKLAVEFGVSIKTPLRLLITYWKRRAPAAEQGEKA
jgi:predicted DNA-binding transcriptional regulator YafY